MSEKKKPTADELKDMQERLGGTPLEPRAKWLLKQAAFVFLCVAGLIVVLRFADGIWLAIGLTVVAFFAGMLPELFLDLRYGKYREEWELVNASHSSQHLGAAD